MEETLKEIKTLLEDISKKTIKSELITRAQAQEEFELSKKSVADIFIRNERYVIKKNKEQKMTRNKFIEILENGG